jgi:hypothetical protein
MPQQAGSSTPPLDQYPNHQHHLTSLEEKDIKTTGKLKKSSQKITTSKQCEGFKKKGKE